MSYILVSLIGDEATEDSDGLSRQLESRVAPTKTFRGENPNHQDVRVAADRDAVFFGHNGHGSLRAWADTSRIWATGKDLGQMCDGARLFLYACSSFDEEGFSLGDEALSNGVEVVVGHESRIIAPDGERGFTPHQMEVLRDAALAMIVAFLDGEDDEMALQLLGQREYDVLADGGLLDLTPTGSRFMNAAIAQRMLYRSLRVKRR